MMLRFGIAAFLIAHGVVHVFVWVMKAPPEVKQSFDAFHSWILGDARGFATPVALATMGVLITAGGMLLFHSGIWRPVAVAGLVASLVLDVLFFNPWLSFIAVVNTALVYGIVAKHWPAVTTIGS